MPVKLIASANFQKNVRRLVKRYPHVIADLDALFSRLQDGQTPGDQIAGVGYTVYKVRLRSSDMNRGESAGFRVIYYIKTALCVYIVTMYAKADQSDIPRKTLRQLVNEILQDTDLSC